MPMPIARAMHETLYNNPLIAAHIRTVEKLGVENGDAFRPANSGRQVYESTGFSRRSSMDDGGRISQRPRR